MMDLAYKDGDITLAGDGLVVEGVELLVQRLNIKFKWFQGEYAYDTDYGVPYFQEILGKRRLDVYDMFELLVSKIEEELGVTKAELTDFDFDETSRKMQVTFAVLSVYGDFMISFGL